MKVVNDDRDESDVPSSPPVVEPVLNTAYLHNIDQDLVNEEKHE